MLKKYFNKIKKIRRNIKSQYINYCRLPLDDKLVLVEGGQGANINGNMFAMLKELKTNSRWSDYKTVFVVTKDTREKAENRMAFYGFDNVITVVRDSNEYCKYLATAGYIMTDNSFPPYFHKRNGQIFLNTWHGTPLKTLGRSNKSSLASLANVQKNYLMSDYALFPNEFTRDVFMNDYCLKDIFKGCSLIANYPRNYIFYDKAAGVDMKKNLGLDGKKVFAYMPTWRDAATKAQMRMQIAKTIDILTELDALLDDSSVLLVNLHFVLASEINCDDFEHIRYFPHEYDTYEVLNACDGLITDYSSVFFDFAVTGKKIILYAYDKDDYLRNRGLYMPFESLPFPIVETASDVLREMNTPSVIPREFIEKYCPNGWVDSCERLFSLMVDGKSDCYTLEKQPDAGKNICLIYGGALPMAHFDSIKDYIERNPGYKYVLAYRQNLTQDKNKAIFEIDKDISTLGLVSAFQFKFRELFSIYLRKFLGSVSDSDTSTEFYKREASRIFYTLSPEIVVDFSNANTTISGILSKLSGKKQYVVHGTFYCTRKRAAKNIEYSRKFEDAHGFERIDNTELEDKMYLSGNTDGMAHSSFRKLSSMKNILPVYFKFRGKMKCVSLFSFRTPEKTRLCDTWLSIGEKQYAPKFIAATKKLSKRHFGIYSFSVPIEDVVDSGATTKVIVAYKNHMDLCVNCHIIYFSPLRNRCLGLRGPMTIYKDTETVAIFRQSRNNRLNIYVRSINVSDKMSHRVKQLFAYGLSLLWHTKKAKKLILLYEKNSSKYEESASVLFEALIDTGYKNAYFIVTRDYEFIDRIPEKYREHIIYKFTFKHYLYFFKSKSFIGTEAIAHSIDLKTFNVLPLRKIFSKKLNYVFLQHGVMYMVSLNSESRGMFKRKSLQGKYRVVVSSQAEADHFIDYGMHYPEDLYITGLPKFDRNTYSDNADKIVIMPTWRPWEINTARADFTNTEYFQMIMRIYNCVPDELKDKVIILPHPLIVNELNKMPSSITDKIALNVRYDDMLKDTSVLITDYSSIAYDAFYRGARVIFYWEEKDHCMEQYGPSTTLMLNEDNVFGDFFYSTEGLEESIRRNYNGAQKQEYTEKYSYIVNFHDGKNTERLIEFLKEDEII